jgi:hypothetical protein
VGLCTPSYFSQEAESKYQLISAYEVHL